MQNLQDIFRQIPYKSIKWDSYFPVYEQLLAKYVGQPVTLVEIGILDGGSLFMWRTFLGPHARIIGIDLNPATKSLEEHGFQIHIGDQASPEFWRHFYAQTGPIDILIDDGGHTNRQQITTLRASLDHVRDKGVMVFEDVHASYMKEFGNPSRYSFIAYSRKLVDEINARNPSVPPGRPSRAADAIHSIAYHESMVCLHIDRTLCRRPDHVAGGTRGLNAVDQRDSDKQLLPGTKALFKRWLRTTFAGEFAARCYYWAARQHRRLSYFRENLSLRRHFR